LWHGHLAHVLLYSAACGEAAFSNRTSESEPVISRLRDCCIELRSMLAEYDSTELVEVRESMGWKQMEAHATVRLAS
jgi:hypothetical protein